MALDVNRLRQRVYDAMNLYTADGQHVSEANEMEALFGDWFDPDDIDDRLLDGARFIAARVRGTYLRELQKSVNLTDNSVLHPSTANGQDPWDRLMGVAGTIGGKMPERRGMRQYLSQEETGKKASANEPAYVFEGYEFVANDGSGGVSSQDAGTLSGVSFTVIKIPMFGGDAAFDGVKWTGNNKTLPLPNRLERPCIQYALASCYMTRRMMNLHQSAWTRMVEGLRPYLLPWAEKELLSQE